MNQFRACIERSDLNALVIKGEAKAEEISEAWANIFYEYCDLIGASETRYRIKLAAEINFEKKKNDCIGTWLKILELYYSEKIVSALRILDIDYDLNPDDPEQYLADIKQIQGELNLNRLIVRIKEAEYKAIQEEESSTETMDERYFDKMFFRINNYARREAVNGMTMVTAYCVALKDYYDHLNNSQN